METIHKVVRWKSRFVLKWWPMLAFIWCTLWFVYSFSPLEQGDAYVRTISPTKFEYSNVSRKPFPSELICRIEDSITIVESNVGESHQRNLRQDNWGTGDSDWTTWKVTGTIPFGAHTMVIHKKLTYRCLGVFYKKVLTQKRILDIDIRPR